MSIQQPAFDYNANVYIAVTLTPSSAYLNNAINLPAYPSVTTAGNVGQLEDVKLLSVPKDEWRSAGDDILKLLREDQGNVLRVDVQEPKIRRKRGDEL